MNLLSNILVRFLDRKNLQRFIYIFLNIFFSVALFSILVSCIALVIVLVLILKDIKHCMRSLPNRRNICASKFKN